MKEMNILELFRELLIDDSLKNKNSTQFFNLTSPSWKNHIFCDEIPDALPELSTQQSIVQIEPYNHEKLKKNGISNYDLNRYIRNSTIDDTVLGVQKFILDFLKKTIVTKETKEMLELFLNDPELLWKTHIVKDSAYRNCVITIQSAHSFVSSTPLPHVHIWKTIEHFKIHSQIIFLEFH